MQSVIRNEPLPIKLWLAQVEPEALEQARHLARLPFAFRHIALMPDCHPGFGMPIGGVLATTGVVIPNAVGVDIGCGVCAVRTSLDGIEAGDLRDLVRDIRTRIPVGFKHQDRPQDLEAMPDTDPQAGELPVVRREYERATRQLGTLGGGNHFIEIQKGSDRRIWIMIHSGSRNIGKQVADYYNRLAVELDRKRRQPLPPAWQLAWLRADSPEGKLYLREMRYCVAFAYANRDLMRKRILDLFTRRFGSAFEPAPPIDIAHNYAVREKHFGRPVIVHRKGATRAGADTTGIIPGSQGSPSFIVRGKGNPESFESCSHGAGRIMGRRAAIRQLDFEAERKRLERQHVLHALRSRNDLDEAAGAYKDIRTVMANQRDLVDVQTELRPLAVIKG